MYIYTHTYITIELRHKNVYNIKNLYITYKNIGEYLQVKYERILKTLSKNLMNIIISQN